MDPVTIITLAAAAITQLINLITRTRTAAQQTGEWTPELEKQFQDLLLLTADQAQWQPDPPPPVKP